MDLKLIPQNFKVIGIVLILISIIFFSFNFFTSFEFEILKNVNLHITLPSMFPKVEGSPNGVNLNQRLFGILLILGLLFITICKQQIENEKFNEIRVNTFILVSKIFVFVNILSLILLLDIMYLYILFINLFFQLVFYNIIFYYKISKLKSL
jgi:hypothetical protein